MRTEPQSTPCPAQAYGTLSSQLDHVCTWRSDRWSRRQIWADRLRDRRSALMDRIEALGVRLPRNRDRFAGGTRWPDGEPKPRTCSYCGGAHPDDVLTLMHRGWEVDATDKGYKRYLHPPGYRAANEEFRASGRWAGPPTPVPPVKVYTYHFDSRQIAAFNYALEEGGK